MKTLTRLIIVIVPALLLPVCATQQSPDLQLISPLGIKLYASTQNDSLIECLNTQLAESPDDISLLFQKGRALYGSQRFNEAIEVWTRCIHLEPENPVFFRRRGHRFISIRKFDQAIDDLNRADELNEIERSEEELWQREWGTYVWQLEKDIWYHLGLAYYLKKDYDSAADAYRKSCDVALTEDSRISSAYWLYLALCKSVRKDQAGLVLDCYLKVK